MYVDPVRVAIGSIETGLIPAVPFTTRVCTQRYFSQEVGPVNTVDAIQACQSVARGVADFATARRFNIGASPLHASSP